MKPIRFLASLPFLCLAAAAPALHAQYLHVSASAGALTDANAVTAQFEYASDSGYTESAPAAGYVGEPTTRAPGAFAFTNYCGIGGGTNPITQGMYGCVSRTTASLPAASVMVSTTGMDGSGGNTLAEIDETVTFNNPRAQSVLLNVVISLRGSLSRDEGDANSHCKLDGTFGFERADGPYSNDPTAYGNKGSFEVQNTTDGRVQTSTFGTGTRSPVEADLPGCGVGGTVTIHITLLPGISTFSVQELLSSSGNENTIVNFSQSGLKLDVPGDVTYTSASGVFLTAHPDFFAGEAALTNGVYYLAFPSGNPFGYYSYLSDQHYIYHQDLGYEYVFDADDGNSGIYLYDFKSGGFFYSSPAFPFPYLYDFTLNTVLYYYPDPSKPGRYNTGGVRYFYNFATGKIISK